MFEFNVNVACPKCRKECHLIACYNPHLEPIENEEECFSCGHKFVLMPPHIEVDGWDCETKEVVNG